MGSSCCGRCHPFCPPLSQDSPAALGLRDPPKVSPPAPPLTDPLRDRFLQPSWTSWPGSAGKSCQVFGAAHDISPVQRVDTGKRSGLQLVNLHIGVRGGTGCELSAHPFTASAVRDHGSNASKAQGMRSGQRRTGPYRSSEVKAKRAGSLSMNMVLINQFS